MNSSSSLNFNVSICSSAGGWFEGILYMDANALVVTIAPPAGSRITGRATIPMASVMFFAKLNPDALIDVPSLLIEFEEGEERSVVGDVFVEPGRLRVAPRHVDMPTVVATSSSSSSVTTVEALWSACCAMSTSLDVLDRVMDNETEDGLTKHKRQRE
jgi:hypothetical protein